MLYEVITKAWLIERRQRKQMIEPGNRKLSISKQCQILDVTRSTFYYNPRAIKAEDLKLMRLIDEQYMKYPTSGTRSMRNHLRRLGYKINRKKVQRLMLV